MKKAPTVFFLLALVGTICSIYFVRTQVRGGQPPERLRVLATKLADSFCTDITVDKSITLDKAKEMAGKITDKVQALRGENKLKAFLKDKNKSSEFINSLVFPAIIWLIGFVIIFIGWWVCCLCCCCDCCNCCTCRNYQQNPITEGEKIKWAVIFLVFGLIQGGFVIAAFAVTGNFIGGTRGLLCATGVLLDDTIYGTDVKVNGNTAYWIGTDNVINSLSKISTEVRNAQTSMLTAGDAGKGNLQTDYNNMNTKIEAIYTSNKDKTFKNPDPTSSDAADLTSPVIAKLGPTSDKNSMTGLLKLELDTKYNFANDAVTTVNSYKKQIATQASSIADQVDSFKKSFASFTEAMVSFRQDMSSQSDTIDSSFKGMGRGFNAVLGVVLFVLGLTVVSFLIYKLCKQNWLCIVFYCIWIFLALTCFFCFALATVFSPFAQVSMDACDIIQEALNDPSKLTTYGNFISADITTKIGVCLVGDGKIVNAFSDVAGQINQLSNFTQYLDQADTLKKNLSTQPDSYVIPIVKDLLNGYQLGYFPAFTTDMNNVQNDRTIKALAGLNSWADATASPSGQKEVSGCQISKDQWLLSQANCTSASRANISQTPDPKVSFGQPSCAGVANWDKGFVASRYDSGAFSSCKGTQTTQGSVDQTVIAYFNKIKDHLDSVKAVFGPIVTTDIKYLEDQNKNFKNDLTSIANDLVSIKGKITTLIELVSNAAGTGLLDRLNCAYIGQDVRFLMQQTCDQMAPALYTIAWLAGVVGVCGLFTTLAVYCLAIKSMREGKGRAGNDPAKQNQNNQYAVPPGNANPYATGYGGGYPPRA